MDDHALPSSEEHTVILLVEDDLFIVDIYQTKLQESGYRVIVANNGEEALAALSKERPQLILLDLIMPKMDGFDFLNAIKKKEDAKNIPVILLTNLSQKEDVERALTLGADDYLIKSHFTPSEVLEKITLFLAERNSSPRP